MDALGDARQSLDRLSLDWASRVRRSDSTGSFASSGSGNFTTLGNINGYFTKQAGNDQISFLSQVQSYSGARRVTWLSYQVNPITQVTQGSQSSTTSALVRGMYPYDWTNAPGGNALLTFPPANPSPTSFSYEPMANTVFRVEFCFLQQVPAGSTVSPFTVDASNTLGATNFAGVVVAVAALDQQSRQLLTQAQLTALANALPRITADGLNPQAVWSTNMAPTGNYLTATTAAGIPKNVANAVRIYQRILYTKE